MVDMGTYKCQGNTEEDTFNFLQEWRNGEDLRENVMFKLGLGIGIDASWTEKEGQAFKLK